jgi:hypothetical protein
MSKYSPQHPVLPLGYETSIDIFKIKLGYVRNACKFFSEDLKGKKPLWET